MIEPLRAVVVMDYQNVHLTGDGLFDISRYRQPHESLVDPLNFGHQLLIKRNCLQRAEMPPATLARVRVFRGQPSPLHDPKAYARSQAQKAHWERDPQVAVTLRPLKYRYRYDENGSPLLDENGQRMWTGKVEKGIDVLCALALVTEALRPDVDLVILASADSDLSPALDEALQLRQAKIETTSWFDLGRPKNSSQLRPTGRNVWNTRLGEQEFVRCWDLTDYT
jgi:hypothetical protein